LASWKRCPGAGFQITIVDCAADLEQRSGPRRDQRICCWCGRAPDGIDCARMRSLLASAASMANSAISCVPDPLKIAAFQHLAAVAGSSETPNLRFASCKPHQRHMRPNDWPPWWPKTWQILITQARGSPKASVWSRSRAIHRRNQVLSQISGADEPGSRESGCLLCE
jgi:hypothetical protein